VDRIEGMETMGETGAAGVMEGVRDDPGVEVIHSHSWSRGGEEGERAKAYLMRFMNFDERCFLRTSVGGGGGV